MSDSKKSMDNNSDDEKLHIEKSVFEVSKDMQKKADDEIQRKIAEKQRIEEEHKRMEQEEHDKRLEAERLELIRLKQGVIDDSEIIHEEQIEVKQNIFQKIGDFFYHNSWWLWIAVFLCLILIWLVSSLVNRPRPDIIFLVIGENYEMGEESGIEEYVAGFTEDFNGNGEILASMYYIPYTANTNKDYINSVDSKLTSELNSARAVILIGNKLTKNVLFDDSLVDLSSIYPDNEHIIKDKFMLSDTDFAEKIGLQKEQISDDWFISIRTPKKLLYSSLDEMQEVYDRDFAVFDAIIKDLSEKE
ncbi:MAG: hypothetical protein K2N27_00225 [Ruminococcus sp.]|nr:hypothetical protein [Ruminococcus sp.]